MLKMLSACAGLLLLAPAALAASDGAALGVDDGDPEGVDAGAPDRAYLARSARSSPRAAPCGHVNGSGGGS